MSPNILNFMHFGITIFLLLIFSTMSFSNGDTDKEYYNVCSSLYSCGHIKGIGYPFWGDDRPEYCGLPEFKLDCGNSKSVDFPHIWTVRGLRGNYYKVRRIDTSNSTIFVARDKNESFCRALVKQDDRPTTNGNGPTPFRLGKGVANVSLFYDCPSNGSHLGSFPCSSIDPNASVLYYLDQPAQVGSKLCKSTNVTIPVSKRVLDEFVGHRNSRTLESVLEEEFEVQYSISSFRDCLGCQNSGGVCGSSVYSSNKFVCYRLGKRWPLGLTLGLGITGGALLITIAVVVSCYHNKRKLARSKLISRALSLESTTSDLERGSLYFGVPLFSYKDLQEATNNFDQSRMLGEGGFGRVYYGKLKDGREVAVKQLYEKSYRRVEQFMNEVQILTCLRHQNLVSLYGCTSPRSRELLLVYEYISNGTVADHLYGEKANSAYLSWTTRIRIAIETANALAYLHASDIIHRDVKTNNILLDGNFGVKVADFGLSRLFPMNVTHVSTAPQGTPGYLDPEYHQCYQLTVKSDVYSFGVVLIELISSLPAVDMSRQRHEINLSNYAMSRIQKCAFEELIDPRLGFRSDFRVRRMTTSVAELAFQCLQHDKEFRPNMDEVSEVLKRIESADYSKEDHEEVLIRRSNDHPASSTTDEEENDGARLLMGKRNNHDLNQQQQIMKPRSPISVMDKWGSRSGCTIVSNTSKQGSNNVFYSINSNSFDNNLFGANK